MTWRSVRIEAITTEMQPGFACQPTGDVAGVQQLRTNNVSADGRIDLSEVKRVPHTAADMGKYLLTPGDILFNNTNSPALVGKTAFFDEPGEYVFSNHMTRIRVNPTLADPCYVARFLHWAWGQGAFRALVTQWVNQAAINRSQLASVTVPLPPLSEQRRIVEILDQADRLRRLRAEADAKADRILPGLFIKMFGDPATNPHGWNTGHLGDVIVETHYGTSKRASSDGGGIVVLRMNNISAAGRIDLTDTKRVALDKEELERLALRPGDILFNRTNSAELVGKTGLWHRCAEPTVAASYLIRCRVNRAKVAPEYIWALMNTPFMKLALAAKARRAVGMANINATELRRLPALFPPLDLQDAFVIRLRHLDELADRRIGLRESIERLFGLLLQRAFSGELTSSWREAHMKELLQEMKHQAKALAKVEQC